MELWDADNVKESTADWGPIRSQGDSFRRRLRLAPAPLRGRKATELIRTKTERGHTSSEYSNFIARTTCSQKELLVRRLCHAVSRIAMTGRNSGIISTCDTSCVSDSVNRRRGKISFSEAGPDKSCAYPQFPECPAWQPPAAYLQVRRHFLVPVGGR